MRYATLANLLSRAITTLLWCIRPSKLVSQMPSRSLVRSKCVRHVHASRTSNRRRYALPRLLIPSSVAFPPVEYCRGISPIHAARSRPFLNCLPSQMAAHSALAPRGPIPGMLIKRRAVSSWLTCNSICRDSVEIRLSNCLKSLQRSLNICRIAGVSSFESSARMLGKSCLKMPTPMRIGDPIFKYKTSALVNNRGALPDDVFTDTVQCLHFDLVMPFYWNETHGRSGYCVGDCFGIERIVFIGLHIGFDELQWNQPHIMP